MLEPCFPAKALPAKPRVQVAIIIRARTVDFLFTIISTIPK